MLCGIGPRLGGDAVVQAGAQTAITYLFKNNLVFLGATLRPISAPEARSF
jgi:hypothetical protein